MKDGDREEERGRRLNFSNGEDYAAGGREEMDNEVERREDEYEKVN
jgi:hypothetical protein